MKVKSFLEESDPEHNAKHERKEQDQRCWSMRDIFINAEDAGKAVY
jgi:hypothetical protein